jgi:hypothetical protein
VKTVTTDGNDLLTQIACFASLKAMLDDTMWEIILEARKQDISLRRIAIVSKIPHTTLARMLEEKNASADTGS